MTSQQIASIERDMIISLLLELVYEREGKDAKLTPCGSGIALEDGFISNTLSESHVVYMLYYNVGADTHAVSLDTELNAEK